MSLSVRLRTDGSSAAGRSARHGDPKHMLQAPAPNQEELIDTIGHLYGKDMVLAPVESCATTVAPCSRPLSLLPPRLAVRRRQSMMRRAFLEPLGFWAFLQIFRLQTATSITC